MLLEISSIPFVFGKTYTQVFLRFSANASSESLANTGFSGLRHLAASSVKIIQAGFVPPVLKTIRATAHRGSNPLPSDRPQGTEITALDNALLSLEGLVDFRAEASGKRLKIDALCKGPVKEAELLRQAERLFPAYEIRVALREAEESDRCLYRGKRCILGGGTESVPEICGE